MKKFILSLALVLAASLSALAQDIIILRNSEKIEAKIVEISSTEIAYKKADYTDGPTFRLDISEVSSVIYANGEVQAFNAEPKGQGTVSSGSGDGTGKLKFNPTPQGRKRPFGISIGYTSKQYSSLILPKFKQDLTENNGTTSALMLGLYWAPEFKYGIGIQTGLYYEMAVDSYTSYDEYYNEAKSHISLHTLSVPLRFQYRYEFIRDLSVFLYTGPSFDIHLASLDDGENIFNGDSSWNRFQVLWGVGAGVRWKGIQLMMGGDWGLMPIAKDWPWKLNKPFFISLSYLF